MRDVIFVILDWISQALANRFIQYKLLIYKDKFFSQVVGLDDLLRLRRVLANPGLLLELPFRSPCSAPGILNLLVTDHFLQQVLEICLAPRITLN